MCIFACKKQSGEIYEQIKLNKKVSVLKSILILIISESILNIPEFLIFSLFYEIKYLIFMSATKFIYFMFCRKKKVQNRRKKLLKNFRLALNTYHAYQKSRNFRKDKYKMRNYSSPVHTVIFHMHLEFMNRKMIIWEEDCI